MRKSHEAREKLLHLGIFRQVDVLIDTCQGTCQRVESPWLSQVTEQWWGWIEVAPEGFPEKSWEVVVCLTEGAGFLCLAKIQYFLNPELHRGSENDSEGES